MTSFEIEFRKKKAGSGTTKFGGQPDWLRDPEWPVSKATGKQMRFVCQINLAEIELTDSDARIAYLFMTEDEEYVDGTWEADGGENAIILQPGENRQTTIKQRTGPSLFEMVEGPTRDQLIPKDFECSAGLKKESADVEFQSNDPEIKNKLRGKPVFIQGDEYPSDEQWDLLIQLDSMAVPFYINFGDAGVGYGFISQDRKRAKFLWQCS